MKTASAPHIRISSWAIALLFLLPSHSGLAKPGGLYRGKAKNNIVTPIGVTIPVTPIKLRLPNGKGRISGTLFVTKSTPAFTDLRITGKVRNAVSRQGGRKHILTGRWSWNFAPTGAGIGKANGKFQINVRKVGKSYKLMPPTKVKIRTGPPSVTFNSKITARK